MINNINSNNLTFKSLIINPHSGKIRDLKEELPDGDRSLNVCPRSKFGFYHSNTSNEKKAAAYMIDNNMRFKFVPISQNKQI